MIITFCMLLYFGLAVVFPLVHTNVGKVTCSPRQSNVVYGIYGGYVLLSTFSEISIIQSMKGILNQDKKGSVSCNRYVIAKWF
jgi:hypothetical protein